MLLNNTTTSSLLKASRALEAQRHPPFTAALLTSGEVRNVLLCSIVGAFFIAWVLGIWNFWLILGFAGFVAPLVHFSFVGTRSLAFPLFLPAIFSFQHIVCSAYCYVNPLAMTKTPLLLLQAPNYFPMAALATWLMYFGVALPMLKVKPVPNWYKEDSAAYTRRLGFEQILLTTFWIAIFVGLAHGILSRLVPGLAFLWLLISKLSYVSIMALGVMRSRHFIHFLLILTAFELSKGLMSALFHPFLFFCLMICCLIVFSGKRWSQKKVLLGLALGAFCLYSFQCVKLDYRDNLKWGHFGVFDKALLLLVSSVDFASKPVEIFSERNRDRAMDRFDQSQIVSLVMTHVPNVESYARGETIYKAIYAALIPRILDPQKYRAGGSEFFFRFTGYRAGEETSINLGQLAESYANFGPFGALLSCTLYAALLGFIWRLFHLRASKNPIWWAWFPFIVLHMVKTEEGFGEIFTYTVKATIVAYIVIKFVPGWQRLLRIKLRMFWQKQRNLA